MSPVPTATNSTIDSSSSGSPSSGLSSSDVISIVGVLVSATAYFVAYAKFISQYATASPLAKCSVGAIGGWARFTRSDWAVLGWKLEILYAQIDLNIYRLLDARAATEKRPKIALPKVGGKSVATKYRWADNNYELGHLRVWHVWHGKHVLMRGDKPVSIFALPFWSMISWLVFLRKHPRPKENVAKASWANLLCCLGVEPTPKLILTHKQAEVIPSNLEAPYQLTTLTNVALLGYVLGMSLTEFDSKKGTIDMSNEFATITISDTKFPGISKVISVEGDMHGLRNYLSEPTSGELREVALRAVGFFDHIVIRPHASSYKPFSILHALQSQNSGQKRLHGEVDITHQVPTNLIWEAKVFQCQTVDANGNWASYWQSLGVGACPTLLQTFAFLPYHNICSGFPLRAYLSPYDQVLSNKSANWWASSGKDLCDVDDDLHWDILHGKVSFLQSCSTFTLTKGIIPGVDGSQSWIFGTLRNELMEWDSGFFKKLTAIGASGTFQNNFSILPNIARLLADGSLEAIRNEIDEVSGEFGRMYIAIEPSLWFTLACLEARIEALWETISGQMRDEKLILLDDITDKRFNLLHDSPTAKQISPSVPGFLALWVSICSSVDPYSERDQLQRGFDDVFATWKGDESLCVPSPNKGTSLVSLDQVVSMTKGEFYQWGVVGQRQNMMRELLPWLQLRSILLYYFLSCNHDSTDLFAATSSRFQTRVAIP